MFRTPRKCGLVCEQYPKEDMVSDTQEGRHFFKRSLSGKTHCCCYPMACIRLEFRWIAKQLGHADTQMLFNIYSKFMPTFTRRNSLAFEKFFDEKLNDIKKPRIVKRQEKMM